MKYMLWFVAVGYFQWNTAVKCAKFCMHTYHDLLCKLCGEVNVWGLQPRGNEVVSNLSQDKSVFAQIMGITGPLSAVQFCNRYCSITLLPPSSVQVTWWSVPNTGVLLSPSADQEGNKLGSMSRNVRDFTKIETRAVIKFLFPLQGKAPKEIHANLTEALCFLPGRAKDLSAPLIDSLQFVLPTTISDGICGMVRWFGDKAENRLRRISVWRSQTASRRTVKAGRYRTSEILNCSNFFPYHLSLHAPKLPAPASSQ